MKHIILTLLVIAGTFNVQAQSFDAASIIEVIPNKQMVGSSIMRGGRPEMSDLAELKQLGYKTIINLENDAKVVAKEKAYAAELGFNYIENPMNASAVPNDQEMEKLIAIMADSRNYPLYIHCKHGQDRTGLVVGLHRVFNDKWKPDVAYQEMLDIGFHPIYASMKKYFFNKTKGL